MAEKKSGKVIFRKQLSPLLEIFRVMPEDDRSPFPDYQAGQYIALSRENCKLTQKVKEPDGSFSYLYSYDETGNIRRGQVTHSYSIASAPSETRRDRYLEFYVVLELVKLELPGRLSESLFHLDPETDNKIWYVNKITGEFTFEKRAGDFENVVMVATGTGLAPFVSMVKEIHSRALEGKPATQRVTLFHANRTFRELGYHEELQAIERAHAFDFTYVPSVSRPIERDFSDPTIGRGRANNLLRMLFGMPLKELEVARQLKAEGKDAAYEERLIQRVTAPVLPSRLSKKQLLERMTQGKTVVMTCGNPKVMEDIEFISKTNGMQFEKEEW